MIRNKNQNSKAITDTLIGENSKIEGKLISQVSLRIEGKVQGDVECEGDVTLGERAVVHSHIAARNVYNAGKIHGSITTEGTLYISPTGSIVGDIEVGSLRIEEGGTFQGTSIMKTAKKQKAESKADISDIQPHLQDRKVKKAK